MEHILVVDDDEAVLSALATLLETHGYRVTVARRGEAGLERVDLDHPDLVIMDIWLPGISGLTAFREMKQRQPWMPTIVITGSSTTELAIEASKLGAFDYLLKPFEPEQMLRVVRLALDSGQAIRRPPPAARRDAPESFEAIVGQGPSMHEVYKAIGRVAPTDATVLIRGESGTGKELVARAIHQHSLRHHKPLIVVNCVAIPETLLESELFGYERGAFTGAVGRRVGRFEQAEGGTLMLDEIGDLPSGVQAKILRVLQERTFERVGGNETLRADVRIIAATNRDIENADGQFRRDLYYRLNVVTIHLPPLRARREDIPALANTFLARAARELGVPKPVITSGAMDLLMHYPWPGNVRQLEHCLRRALIFGRGCPIRTDDLAPQLGQETPAPSDARPAAGGDVLEAEVRRYLSTQSGSRAHGRLMDRVGRLLVVEALRQSGGNLSRAASVLGLPRPTLHAKVQKYGVTRAVQITESDRQLLDGPSAS